MCKLLDKYWNDGVGKGKAESIGIIRSMHRHEMPPEAIAELANQKLEYINRIISLCSQYPAEDDISITKRLLGQE